MTFTQYCQQHNIQLLTDDIMFIRGTLKYIPKTQQKAAVRRYVAIWQDTMSLSKNALKAQNEGRRAANSWLLGVRDGKPT